MNSRRPWGPNLAARPPKHARNASTYDNVKQFWTPDVLTPDVVAGPPKEKSASNALKCNDLKAFWTPDGLAVDLAARPQKEYFKCLKCNNSKPFWNSDGGKCLSKKKLEQVSLPDKLRPDRAARLQPETRNRRRELLAIPYRRKSAIQRFGEGRRTGG